MLLLRLWTYQYDRILVLYEACREDCWGLLSRFVLVVVAERCLLRFSRENVIGCSVQVEIWLCIECPTTVVVSGEPTSVWSDVNRNRQQALPNRVVDKVSLLHLLFLKLSQSALLSQDLHPGLVLPRYRWCVRRR